MKQEPITNPDIENTNPSYWNQVLASHGLSMERAKRSRIQLGSRADRQQLDRVLYVGSSKNLVDIEENQARIRAPKGGKRVEPEGHRPD